MWSNGMTHVGLIDVSSVDAKGNPAVIAVANLDGISSTGAALENINLPGTAINNISANPGQAQRIDRIMTTVQGTVGVQYVPQAQFVDFGSITAAKIGTLSLTGNTAGVAGGNIIAVTGNDFLGPITVTGDIGTIRGVNAQVGQAAHQANITAGSLSNLNVLGVTGLSSITTTTGDLTLNIGSAGVTTGSIINAGGNLYLGTIDAAGAGTLNAKGNIGGFGSTATTLTPLTFTNFAAAWAGTLHAGGSIAAINATGINAMAGNIIADTGDIGAITVSNVAPGNLALCGNVHALKGNIGAITTSGTIGDNLNAAAIIADQGNIGAVTATQILNTFVSAPSTAAGHGIIGAISAHTSTSAAGAGNAGAAIGGSTFHAGTLITSISAHNDTAGVHNAAAALLQGVGIANSTFRSDGDIGKIDVAVTGGPAAVGVQDSKFSNAGNFTDTITIAAGSAGGPMGTGDAIYSTVAAGTIFSTLGSFQKAITVNGNVNGSISLIGAGVNTGVLFLAGYDVGANGVIDGPIPPTDDVLAATTATVTVSSFTVTGNVSGLTIAAGISPTDAFFDGFGLGVNDTLNITDPTHSTIAAYHVSGSTNGSLFEAGTSVPLTQLVTQGQVFTNNQITAFSGNIDNLTITGAFPNTSPFSGNTLNALVGSIGNIYVANTSPIGTDAIGAGNVLNAKAGVGDIVGITAGTGCGINGLTVVGNNWGGTGNVGSVIGVATTANGVDGIVGATKITGNNVATAIVGGTKTTDFLTAQLSAADNTTVTGLLGTGGIVGVSNGTGGIGPVAISGIAGVTVNAQLNIGNVGGSAVSTSATGNHFGINASTFNAGLASAGNIGAITATATATGFTGAVGITADALFNAKFIAGGVAPGSNQIGAVNLTATAGSTGAGIGATANGLAGTSTIQAGIGAGSGSVGAIIANATATADGTALATGLDGTGSVGILIGNTDGATGTVTSINSTGIATSNLGKADAWGINTLTVTAGVGAGTETGSIGAVTGTATATGAATEAKAWGITGGSPLYAGTAAAGKGTIGAITGTATAKVIGSNTVNATAIGLTVDAQAIGGVGCSIGAIAGTADAQASTSGTGNNATANANGIWAGNYSAGTGGATSTGLITSVTGTVTNTIAKSTGTGGGWALATGAGINGTTIYANHAGTGTGTIGAIQGLVATGAGQALSATSASGDATVNGGGLNGVTIGSGDAAGASGSIGAITGTVGSTTATSVVATAGTGNLNTATLQVFGIAEAGGATPIKAGSATSTAANSIGAITGTAYGVASGAKVNAGAVPGTDGVYGICNLTATVDGVNNTGTGETIGAISGTATLTATGNTTSVAGFDTVIASAYGIAGGATITAGSAGAGATTGTVTSVAGTATVKATNAGTAVTDTTTTAGFGIGELTNTITILAGRNGTGVVGNITGDVTEVSGSTAAVDNTAGLGAGNLASTSGAGIAKVTINAGDAVGGVATNTAGTIGSISGTIDKSVTSATGGQAIASLYGAVNLSLTAGDNNTGTATNTSTGSIGYTGAVAGTIKGIITNASVTGLTTDSMGASYEAGLRNLIINAATKGLTGKVGALDGEVTMTATATGTGTAVGGAPAYNATAFLHADGLSLAGNLSVTNAQGAIVTPGTATVGTITGKATLTVNASGTPTAGVQTATAEGYGIAGGANSILIGTSNNQAASVGAIDGELITNITTSTVAGSTAGNGGIGAFGINGLTAITVGNGTGAGTASGLTGKVTQTVTNGPTKAPAGNGISTLTFTANKGATGAIVATATGFNTLVAANALKVYGNAIGSITATSNQSADDAITGSLFQALNSVAGINVTGGVNTTSILAGFAAGNAACNVADNAAATIGVLTTSGTFKSSNLIAGVGAGGDGVWGQHAGGGVADTAGTGTIAGVHIGNSGTDVWGGASGAHPFGIEANVFSTIPQDGANVNCNGGVAANDFLSYGGGGGTDVRIRQF